MIMNGELLNPCRFKLLSRHFPGRIEENYENKQEYYSLARYDAGTFYM
jgi:hypothetical protein